MLLIYSRRILIGARDDKHLVVGRNEQSRSTFSSWADFFCGLSLHLAISMISVRR